jgi:hypothetical protein
MRDLFGLFKFGLRPLSSSSRRKRYIKRMENVDDQNLK